MRCSAIFVLSDGRVWRKFVLGSAKGIDRKLETGTMYYICNNWISGLCSTGFWLNLTCTLYILHSSHNSLVSSYDLKIP
jgi:hypothetical protein